MDAADLVRRIEAARLFTADVTVHGIEGVTFELREPAQLDLRRAVARAHADIGSPDASVVSYHMLVHAARGWSGVTVRRLDPAVAADDPAGAESVAFDRELFAQWIARDTELSDRLSNECFRRERVRSGLEESAEKN